jgi:hypothetical protein
MELGHLPPKDIQAAIDQALRLSLELTMFAKLLRARDEEPPDLASAMGAALLQAIRTMNAAVRLGYSPSDRVYAEVEKNMQDDGWRAAWLERVQGESANTMARSGHLPLTHELS